MLSPNGVTEPVAELRVLSPTAILGYGFPESSFEAGLARDPHVIAAGFARVNPARRGARRLLLTGPVVGGCWAAVLITGRAWAWPIPLLGRIGFGLVLLTVIGLLATAALGTRYRAAARAGIAGCVGIAAIDTVAVTSVMLASPYVTPVMIGAMAGSTARIALSVQTLRPILAR